MYACRFGEDAYAWYKRGSHEGWKPDADMYELLLNWMCTQENLIDEAETIVRLEMLVGSEHSCFTEHTCRPWGVRTCTFIYRCFPHRTCSPAYVLRVCGIAGAGEWCAADGPARKLPDLCRGHVRVGPHSSQRPTEGDAGGEAGSGMPPKHRQLQLHHHGKACYSCTCSITHV